MRPLPSTSIASAMPSSSRSTSTSSFSSSLPSPSSSLPLSSASSSPNGEKPSPSRSAFTLWHEPHSWKVLSSFVMNPCAVWWSGTGSGGSPPSGGPNTVPKSRSPARPTGKSSSPPRSSPGISLTEWQVQHVIPSETTGAPPSPGSGNVSLGVICIPIGAWQFVQSGPMFGSIWSASAVCATVVGLVCATECTARFHSRTMSLWQSAH